MLGEFEVDRTANHFIKEAQAHDSFFNEYHNLSHEDQIAVTQAMNQQIKDDQNLHDIHLTENDYGVITGATVDRSKYSPMRLIDGDQVDVFEDTKLHASIFGPDSDWNPMTWIGVKQAAEQIENRQNHLDQIERQMEQ